MTPPPNRGKDIKYRAAHARVVRARGKASQQPCACGIPALQWSYRGGCPDEKIETAVRGGSVYQCRYSPDPARYDALCLGCHTKRDRWGVMIT